MNNDKHLGAHTAMLAVNILFGLNAAIGKSALAIPTLTPLALNTFRTTGAALLFWTVSLFLPHEKVAKRDYFILFLASLFGVQINQLTFLMGLSLTSPVNSSIIGTLLPVFTMLIAAVYLHEPITLKKGAGVAIGATGAVILVLSSFGGSLGGGSITGDILCTVSAALYACYLVFFRNLIKRYSAFTLMKWMFTYAAVFSAPYCWNDFLHVDFASISPVGWFDIGFVVLGATFLTYMLIPIGQRNLRPTIVSMYNYVQPIVATMTAIIFMGERFTWYKAIAAFLVFVGVWLVTFSRAKEHSLVSK